MSKNKPDVNITEVIDINRLADSMEKVNRMLVKVKAIGNEDAIATWTIVLSNLQWRWRDAMVEYQSDGRFMFQ